MARLTQANATPTAARAVPRPAAGRRLPAVAERITRYLREVWVELRRVEWPGRTELVASTVVVVAVLVILAVYLGAWDALFTWIFTRVLVR
ncbi:MAG: preprotein translocase subunit SecE [Armatimonadota bacterium]|nr:preprotein translocase subunit SecE [Armatimonadota bacterium]MDR7401418.1 preprotein translocase subunit SecE [Armatimonadota bacterium]MDR7404954.1 preprotein translocase subunit SecE [Armatimonadota bacterium]MDR7438165.1 preprotein translocase subunit SecE [Armatimonadota bacterium]MDR7473367.1 preprotein translocase subunit SecE [Armatimonadota bacterium]